MDTGRKRLAERGGDDAVLCSGVGRDVWGRTYGTVPVAREEGVGWGFWILLVSV